MKGLNVLVAFLGGAAVGAAVGILFAPEKGEDTRHKIAEILRKKGIRLNRSEMEILGMVALFYLSFALAYILDPLVGGLMVSFSIIAAFHLLLVLLVITFRKKLIINPMVNFIAGLFFENDNEK